MTKDEEQQVIEVLGGQGFIRVADIQGSDQHILEAARLTSNKEGATAKADKGLIRYLLRHRHTTPFEFAGVTLHVRVPMDCWRQWIRHRTASVNEYSTRYSPAIEEKLVTTPNLWRQQSVSNRQGSEAGQYVEEWPDDIGIWSTDEEGNPHSQPTTDKDHMHWAAVRDPKSIKAGKASWATRLVHLFTGTKLEDVTPGKLLSEKERELHQKSQEIYDERLAFGVAKEQARKDLPLSTMTEAYWKINLHNLLHFLGLRMDGHAQSEIREYAAAIGTQIVAKHFPLTWEAFCDYSLNSITLTALDIAAIRRILQQPNVTGEKHFLDGLTPTLSSTYDNARERNEAIAKLKTLGIAPNSYTYAQD